MMIQEPCGCCAGGRHVAAIPTIWNAPGRPELERRIARYSDARARMMTGLADSRRPALAKLTTRDPSDPSIALLDAWAMVEDVLTFYDERIANEGYLRTATDRQSLVEIAGLVGYQPRPGVAASTYLAFEMETDNDARLEAGIRVRSVPKPGQESQTFETIEDIDARAALNALLPQTRRPQVIPFEAALIVETLWLDGAQTGLSSGDLLLLYFDDEPGHQFLRTIVDVRPEQDELPDRPSVATRTRVQLAHVDVRLLAIFHKLLDGAGDFDFAQMASHLALGADVPELIAAMPVPLPPPAGPPDKFLDLRTDLQRILEVPEPVAPHKSETIGPDALIAALGPRKRSLGRRETAQPIGPDDGAAGVASALAGLPPRRLFDAWRRSQADAPAVDRGAQVFALRRIVSLFGHNAPPQVVAEGETRPWTVAPDENANVLHLESVVPEILAGTHLVIRSFDVVTPPGERIRIRPFIRIFRTAISTSVMNRVAYGLGGPLTRVEVKPGWWSVTASSGDFMGRLFMLALQMATIYGASERLTLSDEPDESPLGTCAPSGPSVLGAPALDLPSDTIRLDRLIDGLTPGRTIVVTGTKATIGGDGRVRSLGVAAAEVATVVRVSHEVEPSQPDGATRTHVQLAAPLSNCYVRSSVRILGNVALATHGETRSEILGSGDARVSRQTFRTQPGPLTYVPADDPSGVSTTLEVRVDDVRWTQVPGAEGPGPADQVFYSAPAGERALVQFGDGIEGARPRTGQQNIRATYRVGIGAQANVEPHSISTLITRPLGLKAVTNPLSATGGAGPDAQEAIRQRAPLAVSALDRLVSVGDHADFALRFAGVAKAVATQLPIEGRSSVHVTIAAEGDASIDPDDGLTRRLKRALRASGDPLLPVFVAARERALLVLSASIRLLPNHRWSVVEPQVRAAVLRRFSFEGRAIGEDALLSDVIDAIQGCDGVDFVDIEGWGAIHEGSVERLATDLGEMLSPAAGASPPERIAVPPARQTANGRARAAGLAYLDPRLPQTFRLSEAPHVR